MDWLSVPTLLALMAVLLPAAWWCWDYVHSLPTISPTDASSGQRRVVLITGCDSGFGQLLTRRLDRLGYRVLASCLTKEGERELQASCSERVQAFSLDLLSPASIEAAKGVVEGAGGHLHALVLNSGLGNSQLIDTMSIETYQRIMTVNFLGPHHTPSTTPHTPPSPSPHPTRPAHLRRPPPPSPCPAPSRPRPPHQAPPPLPPPSPPFHSLASPPRRSRRGHDVRRRRHRRLRCVRVLRVQVCAGGVRRRVA